MLSSDIKQRKCGWIYDVICKLAKCIRRRYDKAFQESPLHKTDRGPLVPCAPTEQKLNCNISN